MVLLLFSSILAQGPDTLWTKTFGGTDEDWGYSVQQTSDGGYILAGVTGSFGVAGSYDFYVIKMDSNGVNIWTKTYGKSGAESARSVQQTSDGGYIVAGMTTSFGAGAADVYLIKTDVQGDTVWTKTYGGTNNDEGYSVQQTMDGGYIITGMTRSFGSGNEDVYLIKTNENGDTLWTKTYGGMGYECGSSVQETSDGGYIVVGTSYSYGVGWGDVYLIKTNINGDMLWTKTYGGTDYDSGSSVVQTSDEGYIIAGVTWSFGENVYVIKINEKGDTLWTRTYGGADYEEGSSVQETSEGYYIITGWTNSFGAGWGDVYLIKVDSQGDTIWTKTYGGTSEDEGYSVQQTFDGGYIIAGVTASFGAGWWDFYLIKTKPDVGIKEQKEDLRHETIDLRLLCHPNPFTTSTTINLPSIEHRVEGIEEKTSAQCQVPSDRKDIVLHIYDVSGRLVKSVPLTTNHLSLGADLSPGIYFLKADGKTVGKVVKVR